MEGMMTFANSSYGASLGWADLGLKADPFSARGVDMNASTLFSQKEIFALCDQLSPLSVFTGITGVGKTTHAKMLAKHFLKNKRRPTQLITASKTMKAAGLLKMVCCRFNIDMPPGDIVDELRIDSVRRTMLNRKEAIALIIDDAQNLSDEALAAVIRLTGLQQNETKLQVALFGLPVVITRAQKEWERCGQKEAFTQGLIRSWGGDQTEAYLISKLKEVGVESARRVCRQTCQKIHQLSGGVPVQINRRASMMLDQLIKGHAKKAQATSIRGSMLWMLALASALTAGFLCYQSMQTPRAESPGWVSRQGFEATTVMDNEFDALEAESSEELAMVSFDLGETSENVIDPVAEALSLLDEEVVDVGGLEELNAVSGEETVTTDDGSWLNHDGFTVQVMATPDENEAMLAAKKYQTSHVVHAARQEKSTYIVLVGDYETMAEAKSEVELLTDQDHNAHPWIRSLSQIRSDVDHLKDIE